MAPAATEPTGPTTDARATGLLAGLSGLLIDGAVGVRSALELVLEFGLILADHDDNDLE